MRNSRTKRLTKVASMEAFFPGVVVLMPGACDTTRCEPHVQHGRQARSKWITSRATPSGSGTVCTYTQWHAWAPHQPRRPATTPAECSRCRPCLPWLRHEPAVAAANAVALRGGRRYVRCGAVWCSAPLANATGNPLMAVEDLQRRQSCGAVCDQGQAAKPTWRHFATGTKSPKVFNLNLVYWASARVLKEARRGEFAEQ